MKTIVCYGASNTWGANPAGGGRFARDVRWPGVLRNTLGEGYEVIEEGLCGRTTVHDDPFEGKYKNGREYLIPCIASHAPVDLVCLFLGTNDMKHRFGLSAYDIASGIGVLADIVRTSNAGPGGKAPKVLIMAPAPVGKLTGLAAMFDGSVEKSAQLGRYYRAVAEQRGCLFLDTADVTRSSDLDGLHLEAADHASLGKAVAEIVRRALE